MVRRIGFGEPDPEQSRGTDRDSDGGRVRPGPDAPPRPENRHPGGRLSGASRSFGSATFPRDGSPAGKRRAKWIIIGFLALWLGFWSFGMVHAFRAFLHSEGFGLLFMGVWLTFAALGWLLVAFLLLALLFGKEVIKSKSP